MMCHISQKKPTLLQIPTYMRIVLSFAILLFVFNAYSTTYTSVTNFGNWDHMSTWDANGIPPNPIPIGDTVVINPAVVMGSNNIINEGTVNVVTALNIGFFSTTFTNNGTVNVSGVLNLSNASIFINNGTLSMNNASFGMFDMSALTNMGVVTYDGGSASIEVYGTNKIFTCNPPPVFSDNPFPTTGSNGSRIFDRSGGLATIDPLPSGCPAPAPIPTLSEWGLILLGMSLSILGIVGIRQRDHARSLK